MKRKIPEQDGKLGRKRRGGFGWLGRLVVAVAALVPLGGVNPAPLAKAQPDQPVIERVEAIRSRLLALEESAGRQPRGYHLVQWYNYWPNWPNWNNWANWPNWGDWCNWCGHAQQRVGRWRWPGR